MDQERNLVLKLAREIQPNAVVHDPLAINLIQESGTDLAFRNMNDFHPNQRTAFLTANMFMQLFSMKVQKDLNLTPLWKQTPFHQ